MPIEKLGLDERDTCKLSTFFYHPSQVIDEIEKTKASEILCSIGKHNSAEKTKLNKKSIDELPENYKIIKMKLQFE